MGVSGEVGGRFQIYKEIPFMNRINPNKKSLNLKKMIKIDKKVPKRPPRPAKTEVLHKKNMFFLLKKTTEPLKKLMLWMKK